MTYHFIITMAFGARQVGFDGNYVTKPGETRAEAYTAIVEDVKRVAADAGIDTGRPVPQFFSFEPNELGA